MDKRNRINRNKLKIRQGDIWEHMYSWRNKISLKKHKKILLSAMIAGSLIFADGLYTTYVYADGGQEIHGISVNVDPGGEPGNNYNNDGAGYLGVAIGNRASSKAGYGTAIGPYAKADALYSNATGFWAQALGQYSAAYGAGARAINNFGVAFGQGSVVSFGKPISEAEYSVYPDIIKKLYTAVKTETGTTVYYQTKILLQNGSIQDKSVFSVAIGASAAATDNYAVAIGFKSSADEMGSLSIGAYSEAKGKQGLALGYVAKAIGDFSTAVGQWSQANGDHAVAIGYGAITEKNQAGVAIGYESHSMRAGGNGWNPITDQVWDGSEAQIEALGLKEKVKALDEEIAQKQALEQQAKEELAKFPNDPDLIEKARVAHNEKAKADEKKNKLFATWKTPTGDVAVGNIDTGMTRQITGVAAGSEDTDAVNVAQLKALNRKNVTQLDALNSKVDTFDTKIENIKKIADGNKIHYLAVGPDNEKNYQAGENYNNDGVEQHGGIAIGFDASSKDGDGIAIGKSAQARGWESTGIGALTYSVGDFSTAMGTRAQAFGKSASAYGSLARAYGANGVAIGTGSLVASKKSITKAEFDALPEEQQVLYNIDKVNPKEFYQYRIKDKDGEKDIATNGTAVGNYASSIGIGGVAVGDHAKSSDIDNVNGSNFGVAIGAYSQNKVAQGVALGAVSVADREGNIRGYLPTKNGIIENFEEAMEAVGKGKEFTELKNEYTQLQEQMNAAKAAYDGDPTNTDLKTKYEQAQQKFNEWNTKYAIMTAPWTSRKGAVSVGNDKKGQTRQIIGVAAGSEDTDAVNVAQLKALNSKVDTVDTKIENVKNIVEDNKVHYLSIGPDNEKNHPAEGNYNNDGAHVYGAIAIGIDSVSEDADAISIGRKSYTNGWESIGIGPLAHATGNYTTVVGHRAQAFGESASAYGALARAYGANGLAIGTAALTAGVKPLTKAEFDALPEEQKAWYNTDKGKQTEFYQYKMRDKTGKITDIITKGTAVGNYAESIGIGGVAVGDHAKSSDINNINGSNFGVSIGAYSQNKVAQGVAIGTLSVSDRAGNIRGYLPTKNGIIEYFEEAMEAVGKGQEFAELGTEYTQAQEQMNAAKAASDGDPTNTDLKTKYEQAKQKFDALTNKFAIMTAPWTSRKGAVSIGNDKKGQTRQIIGVAAGSEDTDAVNVAQLKVLATLPMNIYFGGKVENNTYTPGRENWSMPLNEFRMDFGDGLKATQVTDKDGKKYTLVTFDEESISGKADKDASNIGDAERTAWAGKLGTGTIADNDTNLVTGKTVYEFVNPVKTKSDNNETNITNLTGRVSTNETNIINLQNGFTIKDTGTGTSDVALGGTKPSITFKTNIVDTNGADSFFSATVDKERNVIYTINTKKLKEVMGVAQGVGRMSSWTLKKVGETGAGETIDDNASVEFGVTDGSKGLTVIRDKNKIKYGIDGSQIDISGNTTITTINDKLKADKATVVAGDYVTVTTTANKDAGNTFTVNGPKLESGDNVTITDVKNGEKKVGYKISTKNTTLTAGTTGLSVADGKLKLNVADTDGNAVTGEVDLKTLDLSGNKTIVDIKKDITNINKTEGELSNKADKDATNIDDAAKAKWAEKLGTGIISKDDANLVNGKTVKAALDKKVDGDLSNLTESGKTQVKKLAGEQIAATVTEDFVTEKVKKGSISSTTLDVSGDGKLVNADLKIDIKDGGVTKAKLSEDLKNEIEGKADKTYVDSELAKKATTEALTEGLAKKVDQMTYDTAMANKADQTKVNEELAKKVDTDLSNLTETGKTQVKTLAGEQIAATVNEDFVTGKVKKGSISSTTLDVSGDGKLVNANLTLNIKDKAISKEKLSDALVKEINDKVDIAGVKEQIEPVMAEAKKHAVVSAGANISVTEKTQENGGKIFTVDAKDMRVKSGVVTYDDVGTGSMILTHQDGTTATVTGLKDTYTKSGYYDADQKSLIFTRNDGQKYDVDMSRLINGIDTGMNRLAGKMNGIAASNAALAGLHPLEYDEDDKWNLSAAIGNYKGANAFALGAFYQPNERTMLSIGGTLAGEEHLLNVGLSLKTGPGTAGKVYVSRAAMAREIQALKWQNKQREAESQKLLQDNRAIREENKEMKKELEWLKAQVARLMAK